MNTSQESRKRALQGYLKRCEEVGELPRSDYIAMYTKMAEIDIAKESDPNWSKDNLEFDLRSTDWICAKVKNSQSYAQNLYAALCNQSWQRNEVWPMLKNDHWSCSWRYAGGIVAHMREQGDYMDWYCSGIRGGDEPDVYLNSALPGKFVSEGTVTEEIKQDFFSLGWVMVNDCDD